jgi:mono/diheme cytochrome c family protein
MIVRVPHLRWGLAALLIAALSTPLAGQAPPPPTTSVADGVYTTAQAQRGEMVFRQVCASCHTMLDFSGEVFLRRWPTVGGLFDIVSGTMPQDQPGTLTPQQYSDVLAYFFRSNKFPTGESELPKEIAPLNAIAIPPKPPGR